MNPTRTCPKCAAPLPADAPQGHCPQCLLALAVQAQPGDATKAALEQATKDSGSSAPKSGSPALQFKPGEQVRYFGDYELLEEIARGGMGVVWKARQVSLNRPVALKMILSGSFASDAEVKRFRTEAEAAANLQHPNIVAIHEIGEHEGRHYFSMDFVEGRNLAQTIGGEPLPPLQAATLLKTIAEAVHYAHQRGTLHRDLKPHNVLIDHSGQPRITDFGLAKLTQQESSVTQEGSVMGSPSYMPPEQATGRQADVGPASDVYSLGAILYQMLTGKVPFSGATAVDTLRAVVEQEPVAPGKLNDRVPADLETICLKCLEKKPERRYASARALAEELERFQKHEPILARRANPIRRGWSWFIRHPWMVSGAASLVLLLTLGFAYRLWERVEALEWRIAHPNQTSPYGAGYFFPLWFGTLLSFSFFLQVLPVSTFLYYRARRQLRIWFYHLFAAIGVLQMLFGLFVLRRAAAAQAWNPEIFWGPLLASAVALTNVWFGCALAWKAFREARLNLPGIVTSEEPIEPAIQFADRNALASLLFLEVMLICAMHIFATTAVPSSAPGEWGGFTMGSFGMLGMTWLVTLRPRVSQSKGLERQSFLPPLVLATLFTCLGGFGLASPTWFAPLGFWLLGWAVGVWFLKRYPLQRGGIALPAVATPPPFERFWRKKAAKPDVESAATGSRSLAPKLFGIPPVWKRLGLLLWRKQTAYAFIVGMALFPFFYLVEGWRGMRAWNQAKARLAARVEKVDWAAFTPKSDVPDELNVFKHPFMMEYGVRHGLYAKTKELNWFDHGHLGHELESSVPVSMAALKKLPREFKPATTFVRLDPKLAQAEPAELITFNQKPLAEAVQLLASHAGIQVLFRPEAEPFTKPPQAGRVAARSPTLVTLTLTNTAPAAALDALLKEHHLQPEQDEASGSYRLKPIYTSLTELLERLTRDEAALRQLEGALQRPQARLEWTAETSLLELPSPNFFLLRTAARGLATRSKIHLLEGRPNDALRDLRLVRRIADFAPSHPDLIGAMIRVVVVGAIVEVVEEGLTDELWTGQSLIAVQQELADLDLLRPWSAGMQFERARQLELLRQMGTPGHYKGATNDTAFFLSAFLFNKPFTWEQANLGQSLFLAKMLAAPRGWYYQNMVTLSEAPDLRSVLDPVRQRISNDKYQDHLTRTAEWKKDRSVYRSMAVDYLPNYVKSLVTVAAKQTMLNQAFIACALERHRAAKGAYPDALAALVPEFAAKVPHDLFDGQPLRYRRTADGKYLLYSVGWNSKDDGGTVGIGKDGKPLPFGDGPDWVWQGVPAK